MLGEVVLIVGEGVLKALLLMLGTIAVLFVLTVWLGLSPLHAVWVLLAGSLFIIILVCEAIRRRRSRG